MSACNYWDNNLENSSLLYLGIRYKYNHDCNLVVKEQFRKWSSNVLSH